MNDRELLELAAKAAGIVGEYSEEKKCFSSYMEHGWNPIFDDGDALRLAVNLGLLVDVDCDASTVTAVVPDRAEIVGSLVHVESLLDCNYGMTATRRAIVRAAAEIGKSMK